MLPIECHRNVYIFAAGMHKTTVIVNIHHQTRCFTKSHPTIYTEAVGYALHSHITTFTIPFNTAFLMQLQTKSVNNRKTVKTVMTLTWYRHGTGLQEHTDFKKRGILDFIDF
jgi:hypothetical protein